MSQKNDLFNDEFCDSVGQNLLKIPVHLPINLSTSTSQENLHPGDSKLLPKKGTSEKKRGESESPSSKQSTKCSFQHSPQMFALRPSFRNPSSLMNFGDDCSEVLPVDLKESPRISTQYAGKGEESMAQSTIPSNRKMPSSPQIGRIFKRISPFSNIGQIKKSNQHHGLDIVGMETGNKSPYNQGVETVPSKSVPEVRKIVIARKETLQVTQKKTEKLSFDQYWKAFKEKQERVIIPILKKNPSYQNIGEVERPAIAPAKPVKCLKFDTKEVLFVYDKDE